MANKEISQRVPSVKGMDYSTMTNKVTSAPKSSKEVRMSAMQPKDGKYN